MSLRSKPLKKPNFYMILLRLLQRGSSRGRPRRALTITNHVASLEKPAISN